MGTLVRTFLHIAGVLGIWGAALALCAAFLARGAWPFCLVTPFLPQIGALALVAAVVHGLCASGGNRVGRWLVRGLGLVVASLVAGIVFCGAFGRKVPAMPRATAASQPTLSVLVCNVYSENRDIGAVTALIAKCDADLVLLLELNPRWLAGLRGLDVSYPHHRERPDEFGNFGIGVWSKHEIVSGGIVAVPAQVPQVDIEVRVGVGRTVRFLGVHPLPPVSAAAIERRAAVFHWVAERCTNSPTIVAGDFNATAYCDVALELAATAGLTDATAALHRSWPADEVLYPLSIRIDHIWGSRGMRCVSATREEYVGSDHLPVFARLLEAGG